MKVVPVDLAKLTKEVQEDSIKKTEYNSLKTKVDGIDTDDFVKKTKCDSEIRNLKLKKPDISGLLQTTVFNSKITKVENIIPDITNLVNKTQVTAVENKMPNINGFVKKN